MAHRVTNLLALFVLACSGVTSPKGDAGTLPAIETLDCTWAASESNCWKQAIKAAESCLPPQGAVGTFSADMRRCTFASGTTVLFDPAATLPPPEAGPSFSITDCVARTALATGHFTVRTTAGTVEQETSGNELLVTCPDGSRFGIADVLDLTRCAGAGTSLDYVPGDLWNWGAGTLAYGFTDWPGNQTRTLFTCQQ